MAISQATYSGSPWRYGLPPGVYEDILQAGIAADVRMDVAAFVGLTERGPIATPVAIESWDEFQYFFGRAGYGRILPQSVYMFFSNGGRRCLVVRAVDYSRAKTGKILLPGVESITTGASPVLIAARNPGGWCQQLSLTSEFVQERFTPTLVFQNTQSPQPKAVIQGTPPPVGSLFRFTFGTMTRMDELHFLVDVTALDNGAHRLTGCCPNRFYRAVFSSMTHALSTNMGA
ncbi:hypothetical protein D3OALGA1CA_5786 [Olavius algarvensis associated proteobacterium Delta 3]|nr:hypothetical protein D3OALGA1CA_5786 [Olavius algarvensis associated proteobacterium Delta 3]